MDKKDEEMCSGRDQADAFAPLPLVVFKPLCLQCGQDEIEAVPYH